MGKITHIHTHTYYPVILAEISAKKWKKRKKKKLLLAVV